MGILDNAKAWLILVVVALLVIMSTALYMQHNTIEALRAENDNLTSLIAYHEKLAEQTRNTVKRYTGEITKLRAKARKNEDEITRVINTKQDTCLNTVVNDAILDKLRGR